MYAKRLLGIKELIKRRFSLLGERFQLPEKYKGGRIERWSLYWQGMFMDYKCVAVDVIQEAKDRPFKAILISSGLGILYTALKTNPDEQSFNDHLTHNISDLSLVADSIRNPSAENHVNYLTRCENEGLLRRTDLLFFTLMWVADYPKDCNIYAAQCKYLSPSFLTFHNRIIDIGLFGTWLNMSRKMQDFDVNPEEWSPSG
ncbi:hypothetical protein JTE90_004332 [Oedothorax gibbosus]|uniref:Uncharacterized protein n=1 Tax=Oedothorax gibbosus TaxID=931172 RepID=A0AAV6VKR5_9ARAC|nr:hypothetical protein JTE90_004332 [Oedothorax gibbosus]